MTTATRELLIAAAARLLDEGGVAAVTLRAVGQAVGVSHNAPYKHFKDRSALLAAVAEKDVRALGATFARLAASRVKPMTALKRARSACVAFGREHPARYRLLYSDPEVVERAGPLGAAGRDAFRAFAVLVSNCQRDGSLPAVPLQTLTALIYATLHGLIDLELTGRTHESKGLTDIEKIADVLLDTLGDGSRRPQRTSAER